MSSELPKLAKQITACTRCPRLRSHCQKIAQEKKKQFQQDDYWGKPVPGFGDPSARLLIVGLAPAAHGANRTGRMFTGDGTDGHGSSDFLMRAMHKNGFANQAKSRRRDDGLELHNAWLTAIARCAPPENKPTREEIGHCTTYLERELHLLPVEVIVCLGKMAFDHTLRVLKEAGIQVPRPRPRFVHGAEIGLPGDPPLVLGSFHPSRQNTQTGKLTAAMFNRIFARARRLLSR